MINNNLFWTAFNDELTKIAGPVMHVPMPKGIAAGAAKKAKEMAPAMKPSIYGEAEAAGKQRAAKMRTMQPAGKTVTPKESKYPPTFAEKVEKAKKPISTPTVKQTVVAPPTPFEQAQRSVGKGVEAAKEKGSELASKAKSWGTEALEKTKAYWKGLHPYAKAGIIGGGVGLGALALSRRKKDE